MTTVAQEDPDDVRISDEPLPTTTDPVERVAIDTPDRVDVSTMRDGVIDPVEDIIFPVKDISVPVEIRSESTN